MKQWIGRFGGLLADLPHSNSIVHTARGKALAIGRERHCVKFLQRLRKRVPPLTRQNLPELHCPIRAGAGQYLSVRPKRQAENTPVVASKSPDFLTGFDFPEFYFLVVT